MLLYHIIEVALYIIIGIDISDIIYNLFCKYLKDGGGYLVADIVIYTSIFYFLYTNPFIYCSLAFLTFMIHYVFLLLIAYHVDINQKDIVATATINAKKTIGITQCPFRKISAPIDYTIFSSIFQILGCLLLYKHLYIDISIEI